MNYLWRLSISACDTSASFEASSKTGFPCLSTVFNKISNLSLISFNDQSTKSVTASAFFLLLVLAEKKPLYVTRLSAVPILLCDSAHNNL